MKKSVLITGIAGSGKSTVCKKLNEMGYKAQGIEIIPGLFVAVDKETKTPIDADQKNNLSKIKQTEWICDKNKLAKLLQSAPNESTFYCGTSSNIQEVTDLFDLVIILSASPDELRHRLSTRTTHDFARTTDVQDWLLSWKDNWEKYMKEEKGGIIVSADGSVDEVVQRILKIVA